MKKVFSRRILTTVVLVIALLGTFGAGTLTGYLARSVQAADEPAQFGVFWEAWDIVVNHFVDRDKLDFTHMTYGAIQGMLDSLGDQGHTAFFSPEVARAENSALEGSFEGIGAYVDAQGDQVKIIAPIRGSPAEKAGILAGDVILKVDGKEVTGMNQSDVVSLVRGPAGSKVTLTILHPDAKEPVEIEIVRAQIDVKSVAWARVPDSDIAYVQITQFAADTGDELKRALTAIQDERAAGRPISGIILDLRNDPGGLVNQMMRVGSQFLPEGQVILNERNADGQVNSFKSLGKGLGRDLPMVVLINEGSASASEILAGALQDHGRAKLVGMTTVGTGTVLVPFTLSDGSMIRLGVTNWLTPKMRLIKNQGIEPDVKVEQAPEVPKVDAYKLMDAKTQALPTTDEQFNTALELLQKSVAENPE